MLKEFKVFAMRGNVVDMAVGIIIGTAFGKIITSLVNDIIMPPIGILLGNVDFSKLALTIKEKTAISGDVTINYGLFINSVVDFLIVAFTIFVVIRQLNKFTAKLSKNEVVTKPCPRCCSTIPIKATRCPNCTSEIQML